MGVRKGIKEKGIEWGTEEGGWGMKGGLKNEVRRTEKGNKGMRGEGGR